jgi:hypothetical protein
MKRVHRHGLGEPRGGELSKPIKEPCRDRDLSQVLMKTEPGVTLK